jgi:hypothetical protein
LPELSIRRRNAVDRLSLALEPCARAGVPLVWAQYEMLLSYGEGWNHTQPFRTREEARTGAESFLNTPAEFKADLSS